MSIAMTASPKTTIVTVATGTAAVIMAETADKTQRANGGVLLKALTTNTGIVWVGDSGIDGGTTDGFPLAAGESISIPVSDPSRIYAIATGTQKLAVMYL